MTGPEPFQADGGDGMREFRPQDHIDRRAEQELFRDLMTYQSPARILTICDRGGRGKSSLLKRLRYNCQHEIKPTVPSCLLELDKLGERDPSPFAFASAVATGFTVRGEDVSRRFAKFNGLNDARMNKDFTQFADGSSTFRSRDPRVMARTEVTTMSGGEVNAIKVKRAKKIEVSTLPEFTADQEQRARDRCVDALFDDLRYICATQPMVLLLDGWEGCNLSLRDWIYEEVFASHVLHPDANLRPDLLTIVIAGRPYLPGESRYGLRVDEFRALFESDDDLASCVKSVKSLSEWENEHIREFMVNNGCPAPTESEVNLIREQLRKGKTLDRILDLIDLLRPDPEV